ncbi:MAG: CDP-glycerol glycerophosphotransferase family protein [Lachnospiraceae bacterium]|nr:CDP-glycerol glycerophosphotransferase family protein [Lachnospiraceae bacterium]
MNTAELKELRWERIYLCMTLFVEWEEGSCNAEDALRFYITDPSGKACGTLKSRYDGSGLWNLRFNLTNRGDGVMAEPGDYALAVCNDKDELLCYASCRASASKVSACKRFSYQSDKYYEVSVTDGQLFLHIMRHDGKALKNAALNAKYGLLRLRYDLAHMAGSKEQKPVVLFLSQLSDQIGSNLRAVKDRMIERGLEKDYRIVEYAADCRKEGGKAQVPEAVRLLAKSDIVLMDDHVPFLDRIDPKDTTLIQLWHAGVGFKATGYSRWGHKGSVGPVSAHRKYTWGVTASKQTVPIFSELWGIADEKVIDCGIPRMDAMLDPARAAKTREGLFEKYPACRGKKVILFAPTYRGRDRRDATYPFEKLGFEEWSKRAEAEGYVVLIRMHPWIRQKDFVPVSCRERIIVTDSSDATADLFQIADLLITDYSSVVFEFAPLLRPMLFYVFDKEEYASSRGFHHDFAKNAPGREVTDFEGLLDAISADKGDISAVDAYTKRFFDRERLDGHSCDRVIDWLIAGQLPGEYQEALASYEKRVERMKDLWFSPLP